MDYQRLTGQGENNCSLANILPYLSNIFLFFQAQSFHLLVQSSNQPSIQHPQNYPKDSQGEKVEQERKGKGRHLTKL